MNKKILVLLAAWLIIVGCISVGCSVVEKHTIGELNEQPTEITEGI